MDKEDNFELEDFKYTVQRINTFETRFYQILLFAIASYGTIIGLSDKINQELIPLILSLILYILTYYASKQRIFQAHDSAYLLKKYYERYKNMAHDSFYNYYVNYRYSNKSWISTVGKHLSSFITYPFTILLCINVYFFFVYNLENVKCKFNENPWTLSMYILIFVILCIMTIFQICRYKRHNYRFFQKLYDNFIRSRK